VRFWDSSALAPLLVEEHDSGLREAQVREDREILVWFGTPAELESALSRRRREGRLAGAEERHARARLDMVSRSWREVQPTILVRDRAVRLLRVHPLRAADAFQLAAALVACEEQTRSSVFLTGDARLREAAEAEGFTVDT